MSGTNGTSSTHSPTRQLCLAPVARTVAGIDNVSTSLAMATQLLARALFTGLGIGVTRVYRLLAVNLSE